MKKPKFLTNWKTTVAGLITMIVAAGPQVMHMLDDDPATNPEWKIVGAAAMVFFGFAASRDGDKSSKGDKI